MLICWSVEVLSMMIKCIFDGCLTNTSFCMVFISLLMVFFIVVPKEMFML